MSHKISLASLVLQFKRDNEGKGVHANQILTGLVAYSIAFNSPLPNNGECGSLDAANQLVRPVLRKIASDVNELYAINIGTIEDLTVGLYCNRYDSCYGGARGLECFSVQDILKEAIGEESLASLRIWLSRFYDTIKFYLNEHPRG
ncbi:MAG: hypothetical protein ACRDBQ_18610 [Shewanella sp.]